jgi:putative transposase
MGGKKVNGRKRHYLVDTQGHVLAVLVTAADMGDRAAARWLFRDHVGRWPTVRKVWADQGYTGDLADELRDQYGIDFEVVGKPAEQEGFVPLPKRWIVERSIAWQGRNRRLSKDYEHGAEYSESWCYIASIHRLVRGLHPTPTVEPSYARKSA